MKIKEMYYFFYYTIYRLWNRNYNPFLSDRFRTDISVIAIKIWLLGTIDTYFALIFNYDSKDISIYSPKVVIALILIIGSTLYFFTFSNKWKSYFELFDRWPKRKRRIGGIIVWAITVAIFANLIISVEYMHKKFKIGSYNSKVIAKERREDSLQRAKQIENLKKIYGEDKK